MSDLISRQDAIDALGDEPEVWNDTDAEWAERDAWVMHKVAIEALPSADAVSRDDLIKAYEKGLQAQVVDLTESRPPGEWIRSHLLPNGWHCSLCDAPVMTDDISEMLFCPNCGTRMYKGGESDG